MPNEDLYKKILSSLSSVSHVKVIGHRQYTNSEGLVGVAFSEKGNTWPGQSSTVYDTPDSPGRLTGYSEYYACLSEIFLTVETTPKYFTLFGKRLFAFGEPLPLSSLGRVKDALARREEIGQPLYEGERILIYERPLEQKPFDRRSFELVTVGLGSFLSGFSEMECSRDGKIIESMCFQGPLAFELMNAHVAKYGQN